MAVATDVRVTFPLEIFRSTFATVARAVPGKSPKPVLLCVRLDLVPGEAVFTSTNLELWLRRSIPCDYQGDPASILLSRETMTNILKVADGPVTLEIEDDRLSIRAGSGSWTVPTDDPSIFPIADVMEMPSFHEVESEHMAMMIRRTIREARPGTEKGYDLSGLQFEPMLTAVGLTSANGRSLAHQEVPAAPGGTPVFPSPLPVIPDMAIRTLATILADSDEPVRVGFPNANWAQFEVGSTTLSARLCTGRFLKWREAMARFDVPVGKTTMKAGRLRLALACASVSLDSDTRRIDLEFSEDELRLSSRSSRGQSEATETIEWRGKGEPTLMIDPQYAVNMLGAVASETPVVVTVYPDGLPLQFTTEDGFLGLVQPLRKD